MDLGNILNTAIKGVVDYNIAKVSTPSVAYNAPSVQAQPAFSTLPGQVYDYFFDETTGETVAVQKKKRCRRRRRRLATKSDLGDLAALKAILGNGEAFKAWIATHSR